MPEQSAELFRIEAGLLAFILAFYALCARERKAPYITHTVYGELGLVLLAVLVTLLSSVSSDFSKLSWIFRAIAQLLLLAATALTIKRVYSIANRDLRLRDDGWWRMLPGSWQYYLWQRRRKHEKRPGRSYEFQSLSPDDELVKAIEQAGWRRTEVPTAASTGVQTNGGPELSATLSLVTSSYRSCDLPMLKLATAFLQSGAYVQYTPCARHPTEFLLKLRSYWLQAIEKTDGSRKWTEVTRQVVVVDGYTPHFGFHDSVHEERTKFVKKQLAGAVISCRPTFAGIHTATAEAFNWIKEKEGGEQDAPRKPALLVFEGAYALVDLESQEQYRRFLRHVIPSERMWGSMFTLITEIGLDDGSDALLYGYSDYVLRRLGSSEGNEG